MLNIEKQIKKNKGTITLLFCAAAVFSAFKATESFSGYFKELPVEGISTGKAVRAQRTDLNHLPLLYAEAAKKNTTSIDDLSPVDIDAAFLPSAPAPEEKILVDHFKMLPNALVIDGVSGKGAFIAGEYVPFGGKLESYSYPGPDGSVNVPVLVGQSGKFLIVRESGSTTGRTERIPF